MTNEHVRLQTHLGIVHGTVDDDVRVFRGIRFAQPVGGVRRFAEPVPMSVDGSPIDATRFGPSPLQSRSHYPPGLQLDDFGDDCLSLNIWAPGEPTAEVPVLVWLYGGGFISGGTAAELYDGATLARLGMVVVSVNYRVGAPGFAHLGHHGGDLVGTTNLGVKDVICALSWIRDHVAEFGGNPEQVTVAGQSAGAFLCGGLIAAPTARGLFQQLIMLSGGPYKVLPRDAAEVQGDAFLDRVGMPKAGSAISLDALGDLASESWLRATDWLTIPDVGERNGPIVRGLCVTDDSHLERGLIEMHPMDAIRSGAFSGVRALITTTSDELRFYRQRGPREFTPTSARGELERQLESWGLAESRASEIVDFYTNLHPDLNDAREALLTDYIFHVPLARTAQALGAAGEPTWFAELAVPGAPATGHAGELASLFGGSFEHRMGLPRDFGIRLRDIVADFVKGRELTWPVFDDEATVGYVSSSVEVRPDRFGTRLGLWKAIARP